MQLFTCDELEKVPWPDTEDGSYAKDILTEYIKHGVNKFISNVHVDISILCDGNIVLPVSIPNPHKENCYVCSPIEHYITYSKFETRELKKPKLEKSIKTLLNAFKKYSHWANMDKVVYVNNWFLSTNLYPNITHEQLLKIKHILIRKFPNRAIIFRSLNEYTNQQLMRDLKSCDFFQVLSRQLYISDPSYPEYRKKKDFKNDIRHFKKSGYDVIDSSQLKKEDYKRVIELYNMLYIDKYTNLNPLFTESLIELSIKKKAFHIYAIKKEGKIDGVLGFFHRNGCMTTPIFGYDTTLPAKAGLYRIITTILVKKSEEYGFILNQSSGASKFKRTRGCEPYLEYSAIYDNHISYKQKSIWRALQLMTDAIAKPLLVHQEL